MKISEFLESRRKENKDKAEKGMGYVPFNVTSFAQLDSVEHAHKIKKEYSELLYDFIQIADNIMWEEPDNMDMLLTKLVSDLNSRMVKVRLEVGEMFKSGSMSLYKAANGQLQWMGVPTNKFIDRENDILSDYAHREFVKGVKEGLYPYPDLYPWHTGFVGKCTWIDYDERGFVVAGGYVAPEYETFVVNLVANTTEPMGMSHGMYKKDIVRDSDGIIIKYKSFEVSFLPQSKAANLLTSFTTSGN